MTAGSIKRLVKDRGFGFIKSDDSAIEFFFHRSETIENFDLLREGDSVEFEIAPSPKGPRADRVSVIRRDEAL
jgi:CspA family cold shock protein